MTQLIQTMLERLEQFPETVQDRYAARFIRALEKDLEAAPEEEEPFVSAYDVSKHLAGIAKGGPDDVASNPKYMKGFGESSMQ